MAHSIQNEEYNIMRHCVSVSHLMQSTSRVKSLSRPPRYLIYFLFTSLHTVDHFDTKMATKSHSSASAESGIHLCDVLSFSQGF